MQTDHPQSNSANNSIGWARHALLALTLAAGAGAAQAVSVTHQATDLADATPGEDLWVMQFNLTGPLASFHAVNLLFSPSAYSQLVALGNTAPTELGMAPEVEPDAGLGTDGQVTVSALADLDASFAGSIGVSFVWAGAGAPGALPYEVLDDSFNVIGTGRTMPVPEPASMLLMAVGIGALLSRRQRAQR